MKAHLKKSENELHIATVSLKKSVEEVDATKEELKATNEELSTRITILETLIKTSSSNCALPSCTWTLLKMIILFCACLGERLKLQVGFFWYSWYSFEVVDHLTF